MTKFDIELFDEANSQSDFIFVRWANRLMRIGIATGPITAGVIGKAKFVYDVLGTNRQSRLAFGVQWRAAKDPRVRCNETGIGVELRF